MSNSTPKLPDAERDVLACLNQLGEATVKELQVALQPVRQMEAASVLTLLKRMEDKGLVAKRKADKGKAFVFRPTEQSAVVCRGLMTDLFQRVFGGDTMAFMASFFETEKPTAQEIDQLKELLEDLKRKKQDSKRRGGKHE